jgi:hypothetical protein
MEEVALIAIVASPDLDIYAPATALGFYDVVPGGAHCGFVVFPASPEVCVWLNLDASCVAAQQYAAINPIKGFC